MNQLTEEEKYMQRCLQLAKLAEGHTYPNPMVGSVIVHNGRIIGEGYHRKAGEPHAEVNAVNSVKEKHLLKEATLYVNLEPCAHYGKTPPCSKLIIDCKIPNVVIGCIDSFSEVAGKGVEMMEKAGINLKVGVLEQESFYLNRRFFTFHNKQRPYVILKWAQTEDGFIDIDRTDENYGQPTWITNDWARRAVHRQRSTEQGILIGTQTAIKDNPSLTVRDWFGNQPLRIVIDRNCCLSNELKVMDASTPTLIFNSLKNEKKENLEFMKIDFQELPQAMLQALWDKGLQSIVIEGGRATLQSFIDAQLWDEAFCYTGQVRFNNGIKAPDCKGELIHKEEFGNSRLHVYSNNL